MCSNGYCTSLLNPVSVELASGISAVHLEQNLILNCLKLFFGDIDKLPKAGGIT